MRPLLIVTALVALYVGGTALGVYGLFTAALQQIEITRALGNEHKAPRSGVERSGAWPGTLNPGDRRPNHV